MKFIKSILISLFSSIIVISTSVPAFAATNSEFIAKLKNVGADSNTITAATNYLNSHTVSSSNLDTAIAKITDVTTKYPTVKSMSDYNALSSSDQQVIASDVKATISALGASIVKNSNGSYTVQDSSGANVINYGSSATTIGSNYSGLTGAAANTTATNYGNSLVIGGALILLAAISILLFSRRRKHES